MAQQDWGREVSAQEAWARLEVAGPPEWRHALASWWQGVSAKGVLLHEGDLEADSLGIGPKPLVVSGSVRLKGLLQDGHAADHTLLVVLGDLDAENVATFSAMFIAGNVRIRGLLFCDSYGDDVFCVGGGLKARTIVEQHHHIQVNGPLDVDVLVGDKLTATEKPRRRLEPHEALLPGAFTVEDEDEDEGDVTDSTVDRKGLLAKLLAGEPLLAETRLSPVEKAIAAVKEKAARGEKATRLGLAQKKLKAIPEEVFSLTTLESLTLDTNDIAEVSPRIGELRALKNLSLDSLPLTTLPVELCRLPSLKKLSLRYCNHLTRLPDAFGELEALEELHLDAMALEDFPEVLTRLPRLKKLWLWRFFKMTPGRVQALVDGLGRMPKLTHAGFLQGELSALPGGLAPLARLRQFKLGLDRVPEAEVKRLEAALPPGRLHLGY
ncbi:leucine-rich repeat domain-containing protein [Corallococcus aberystwythensis]|uniref:Leucine-rich repeat domain-containing protein n=1 Tax=Corallococcus aberystwythensis TaxID=2316722 RepID=A0A3A8QHU9_9BACT|nr:leucine-rich repeat domain-containing protein [Corallococcus aberystwythensis]RKH64462.1 leucine-rich repeat domain-containing protein [Corallococcus aberystwythensis]